jgi:osmotically-inducible protein OsmY
VTVEVRQKTVYLRGTVSRWGDATDLTNVVRRVPGVEAVVLESLQVDQNSIGR